MGLPAGYGRPGACQLARSLLGVLSAGPGSWPCAPTCLPCHQAMGGRRSTEGVGEEPGSPQSTVSPAAPREQPGPPWPPSPRVAHTAGAEGVGKRATTHLLLPTWAKCHSPPSSPGPLFPSKDGALRWSPQRAAVWTYPSCVRAPLCPAPHCAQACCPPSCLSTSPLLPCPGSDFFPQTLFLGPAFWCPCQQSTQCHSHPPLAAGWPLLPSLLFSWTAVSGGWWMRRPCLCSPLHLQPPAFRPPLQALLATQSHAASRHEPLGTESWQPAEPVSLGLPPHSGGSMFSHSLPEVPCV